MALSRAQLDATRLGALAAAYKKKASPDQWKKIVGDAHARGFAVNTFLDTSTPDALKPRTQEGIRKQALSTVSAAFAPAEQALTDQEKRAQALAEKRRQDNATYNEWLTAKQAELAAHDQAAQAAIQTQQQQIAQETAGALGQMKDQLTQHAAQTFGNVSDPSQAKAFDFSNEAQRNHDMVAEARRQTTNAIGNANEHESAMAQSNLAFAGNREAKRQDDLNATMTGIGGERAKLGSDKAAEIAKQIAGLISDETTKASANRDYGLAADRLGVQSDAINQRAQAAELASTDRNSALAERKRAAQAREAQARVNERNRKMDSDRKYQEDVKEHGRKAAKERYLVRIGYYEKNGTKARQPDMKGAQLIDHLSTGFSNPHDPAQLSKDKQTLISHGHDKRMIQAGAEVAKYGKLKPGTYRRLKQTGVYIPPEWRP